MATSEILKLNDREIRQALISSLRRRAIAPRATLEEVHVCNGNAIADVVAVHKTMHCYEIKGETDSIHRISRQSEFYDQAFCLISLVTTKNHLERALAIGPNHWGIMVANEGLDGGISFRHIRGAKRSPYYRPEIALLSLWRSELLQFPFCNSFEFGKMNRAKIAEAIASRASTKAINEGLGEALISRRERQTTLDSLEPYK